MSYHDDFARFSTLIIQALLHASLDRSVLSIEGFSRWLRALCTILLSRNSAADRAKALGYVEQAFAVMESNGDDPKDSNQVCTCVCRSTAPQTTSYFIVVLPNRRATVVIGYLLQYRDRMLAVRRSFL